MSQHLPLSQYSGGELNFLFGAQSIETGHLTDVPVGTAFHQKTY